MICVRSHFRRNEFDVQCWRCDYFVNISDAIFIESVRNGFLKWLFRYPVRYMCNECIVEIAGYIRNDYND